MLITINKLRDTPNSPSKLSKITFATTPIINDAIKIFPVSLIKSLKPISIIFLKSFTKSRVAIIADKLVANAKPLRPKYFDNKIFRSIFIITAITEFLTGIRVLPIE